MPLSSRQTELETYQEGDERPLLTSSPEITNVLGEILLELRKLNLQMTHMTGVQTEDLEDV